MIELTFDYLKTLPTIGALKEVIKEANSPIKLPQIEFTGERCEDRRRNIEYSQKGSSQESLSLFAFTLSLTPRTDYAQDLIDSVEYSPEEQADLNLTKIDGLEETFYIK